MESAVFFERVDGSRACHRCFSEKEEQSIPSGNRSTDTKCPRIRTPQHETSGGVFFLYLTCTRQFPLVKGLSVPDMSKQMWSLYFPMLLSLSLSRKSSLLHENNKRLVSSTVILPVIKYRFYMPFHLFDFFNYAVKVLLRRLFVSIKGTFQPLIPKDILRGYCRATPVKTSFRLSVYSLTDKSG